MSKIFDYILKHVEARPDHLAIHEICTARKISYSELYADVIAHSKTIDPDLTQVHVINKPNGYELVLEMLACTLVGKIFFCVNPFVTPEQTGLQLDFIKQVFYYKSDGYQIRMSSGTTDLAKFFYSTQQDRLDHARTISNRLKIAPTDSILTLATPLNVGLGDSSIVRTLTSGATLLIGNSTEIYDNFVYIIQYKPSVIFSTSGVLSKVLLLEQCNSLLAKGTFKKLSPRVWDVGGGPLNVDHAYKMESLIEGAVIQHCNRADTSEPHMCSIDDPQEKRITTIGKPVGLKIDADGEILVEAKYVVERLGFGKPIQDGYYATGDLAELDSQGYMRIIGRKKLLLTQGGHDINPLEIERVAKRLPFIKEACCVGVKLPDMPTIEQPYLFLECHTFGETSGVLDNILSELNIKIAYCSVETELPLIKPGKVDRKKLTELAHVYIQNNK